MQNENSSNNGNSSKSFEVKRWERNNNLWAKRRERWNAWKNRRNYNDTEVDPYTGKSFPVADRE